MESQGRRQEAYEMVRYEDSDRAIDNTNDVHLHEKEGREVNVNVNVNVNATELATFGKADNDEPLSIAEAVTIVTAAAGAEEEEEAVEEKHHQQQQHQQHEVDVKRAEVKDESHLRSNLEAAADYDDVSTASLSQHQPGPSKTELDVSQI